MARSFVGSLKGALSHADKAFGHGRRTSRSPDNGGCGGCLVLLALLVGIAVVVEYWIPILATLAIATAVLAIVVIVRRLNEGRSGVSDTRDKQVVEMLIASAGWYADPTGSHNQRYWDGHAWTDSVAD